MYNYQNATSIPRKISNWQVIERKLLWKFQLKLTSDAIEQIAEAKMGAVDVLLLQLMKKIQQLQAQMKAPPLQRKIKFID